MSGNEERQQSEFNMAVSYLGRLNNLFYLCDEASMQLNINQWMHSLMAIFRELSTEMTDQEIKELNEAFKRINNDVQTYNQQQNKGNLSGVQPELYEAIHGIELKIRGVLKKSGLQMRMQQDARASLE